ncbi:MAG: hypothetical protein HY691_12215 [Chloroflexi bacterium]|nr:hypothetical protein [Chloroflexota bacterium]
MPDDKSATRRRVTHSAAVRAAVTAELLGGESQHDSADRHGVPRSTVANWAAALPQDMRDALRANHGWQDLAAQVLETGLLALGRALARLDEAPAAEAVHVAAGAVRIAAEVVLTARALGLGITDVTPLPEPDAGPDSQPDDATDAASSGKRPQLAQSTP